MPRGTVEGALLRRVALPRLRPRPPQKPRRVAVQPLQAAGVADQWHAVRGDHTVAAHMVFGYLLADPAQEWHLDAGTAAAVGRVPQGFPSVIGDGPARQRSGARRHRADGRWVLGRRTSRRRGPRQPAQDTVRGGAAMHAAGPSDCHTQGSGVRVSKDRAGRMGATSSGTRHGYRVRWHGVFFGA